LIALATEVNAVNNCQHWIGVQNVETDCVRIVQCLSSLGGTRVSEQGTSRQMNVIYKAPKVYLLTKHVTQLSTSFDNVCPLHALIHVLLYTNQSFTTLL